MKYKPRAPNVPALQTHPTKKTHTHCNQLEFLLLFFVFRKKKINIFCLNEKWLKIGCENLCGKMNILCSTQTYFCSYLGRDALIVCVYTDNVQALCGLVYVCVVCVCAVLL